METHVWPDLHQNLLLSHMPTQSHGYSGLAWSPQSYSFSACLGGPGKMHSIEQ